MQAGRSGKSRAVTYAVLLHAIVLLVLVSNRGMESNPNPPPATPIVKARAVDVKSIDEQRKRRRDAAARTQREAEKVAADAEQKRRAQARKLKELKEAQARSASKKAAEKKRIAAEKKKLEQEQRLLAERKQTEARERQRIAEEKRKAREEEQRRAREEAEKLAEALANEEEERAAATRQRADDAEIARYIEAVRTRVAGVFIYPDLNDGLKCTLYVRMIPGGEVVEARVMQSSGNASFDRQAENAVRKAAPLPVPSDPRLFQRMREIKFVFDPEP